MKPAAVLPIRTGMLVLILTAGLALGLISTMPPPSAVAGKVLNDALVTKPFSHTLWQEVLTRYVNSQGQVNLTSLRAHPKRLNQYLTQLAAVSPDSHPTWFPSPEDKLAYWLNAYNALALRLVLDVYPAQALDNITHFEQNSRYHLGGKSYNLTRLRPKIMAASGAQPNVLFALSHYTEDSPPILNQAYGKPQLTQQLEHARQQALADSKLIRFNRDNPTCLAIELSPFFQGFESALMAPAPGADEAQDILDSTGDPVSSSPTPPKGWVEQLRPLMPPDVYADLGKPCGHEVRFMPFNATFRQVLP